MTAAENADWVIERFSVNPTLEVLSRDGSSIYVHQTTQEWKLYIREYVGWNDSMNIPAHGPVIAEVNNNYNLTGIYSGISTKPAL